MDEGLVSSCGAHGGPGCPSEGPSGRGRLAFSASCRDMCVSVDSLQGPPITTFMDPCPGVQTPGLCLPCPQVPPLLVTWALGCSGAPWRPPQKVPCGLGQADPTSLPSFLNGASHSERPPPPGVPQQAEVEGHQGWGTPGQFWGLVVCGPRLPRPQGLDSCQGHLMEGSPGSVSSPQGHAKPGPSQLEA